MKKILSFALALLMLTSAMVFTTSAAETAATLPTTELIPFATEDNMPSADADNATLEAQAWNGIKWNGTGMTDSTIAYDNGAKSVYYAINGVTTSTAGFIAYAYGVGAVDITGATSICFDLFISDVDNIQQGSKLWKLELVGKDASGASKTQAINSITLQALNGGALVSGWNHISVPLSQVVDNGAFTITQLERVGLWCRDTGMGVAGETTIFKLKSIYFLKENILELGSFTKSSALKKGPTGGQENKAGAVKFTGFNNEMANISDMTTLSFMIYIPNAWAADAAKINWKLQLYTVAASETDANALSCTKTLAAWCGGTVRGNTWNYVEAPLSAFGKGANADITKFTGFRFFNNAVFTPASGGSATIAEMRLTAAPTASAATYFLMQADLMNDKVPTAEEAANMNGVWHRNPTATPYFGESGSAAVGGLKYNAELGGVGFTHTGVMKNCAPRLQVAWTTFSLDAMVHFDMYVSDIEQAKTGSGLAVYVAGMTASNPVIRKTLAEWGVTQSGWNHISFKLNELSNLTEGATTLKLQEISPMLVNSSGNEASGSAEKPLTVLYRNYYVTADAGVAKVASATPTLTNSFNLTYKVAADTQIVSKPIVDLTFDGETTRQTLNAAGTFEFNGVLAHRLSDEITTTVTALDKSGNIVKTTKTYSLKQYAANKLGGEDAALNRLLSDMLYYGAAAQALIDHNMDNLASDVAGIADKVALDTATLDTYAIESPLTDTRSAEAKAAATATWRSASLLLDSALNIRFTFSLTEGADVPTVKVSGKEYTPVQAENGTYYVDVPTYAANFANELVASFGDDASYTVTYSVNAYLANMYKKYAPDSEMYEMLTAIYNYGVSAAAYAKN